MKRAALGTIGALAAVSAAAWWLSGANALDRAREALRTDPRFREVRLSTPEAGGTLTGVVESPEDLGALAALVGSSRPALQNRVQVRARLDAITELDERTNLESVSVRGFLPESAGAQQLPEVFAGVTAGRKISETRVTYVASATALPAFDRARLALLAAEFSRMPSIGMIELNATGILLTGDTFPAQKARLEELAAGAVQAPAIVCSELQTIDLTEPAQRALAGVPGLESVTVTFNEAYATLNGDVASAELRAKAAEVIRSIRLARVLESQNLITLAGSFTATVGKDPAGRAVLALAGVLPDEAWKTELIAAAKRVKPEWTLETSGLRFARSVQPAGWLDRSRFLAFFSEFFSLPAPGDLRINSDGIKLAGKITAPIRERLLAAARAFGFPDRQITTAFAEFPSVYHMPEYRRVSRIPDDVRPSLEAALAGAIVDFDAHGPGLAPADEDKLARAAAGPEISLVIGCYRDPLATDPEAAAIGRKRAEVVKGGLVARGVSETRLFLETFALEASTGSSGASSHTPGLVEMLIR